MKNLGSRLQALYRYLLLAPAVLPLFYVSGLMYPMLAPKTFALRTLGIITLGLFVYLVSSGGAFYFARLKRWYSWLPAALLLVAHIASLQGVDFYRSFWSTFERGDGLLTLTVCVDYFYLILLSADEKFARILLKVVAWVGAIAGAYVFLQWLNITTGLNLSIIAKANGRVGGTMGNAAFLAAYLGMTFFITLGVIKEYQGTWRNILWWGAGFELLGIFLAATRGTILALVMIGIGVLVHEALRGAGARKTFATRALIGGVVVGVLFVVLRGPLSHVPIEPIKRIASISLNDGTVSSRLFLWSSLLPEALKHPLLGVGAEHIETLFDKIYDPTQIAEEWFDRSHNAYLDYLLQFGVIGLALYLALIACGLWGSWRIHRPYLFLALLTYAIQNFFVFDTGVTLWLVLALLALTATGITEGEAKRLSLFAGAPWVGASIGVACVLLLWPMVIQPLRANLLAFDAYLYHVVDVTRSDKDTTKGLALDTYADLEFGYNAYFEYTEEQLTLLKGVDLDTAYATVRGVLEANHERYPYDARTAVYLAHVLDSTPPDIAVDRDALKAVLASAIALSPKRAQPWYILANTSLSDAKALTGAARAERYSAALEILKAYITLVPSLSEPHYVLADLYLALGDHMASATEAALGRQHYVSDLTTARRAAAYYEKVTDLENAKFFLLEILADEPDNEAVKADLATIEAYEKSH